MANSSNPLHPRDPLPVGFRFAPTDEELLDHYLMNKVSGNEQLVSNIPQIDVYSYEPWELPGLLNDRTGGVEKLFFFSTLDFMNSNGKRTSRLTRSGFWKSTGGDRKIRAGGTNQLIGTKKSLVYHRGRAHNANRTNWVIHQYSLHTDTPFQNLRPFVVCRLKKKSDMKVAQFDRPNDLTTIENPITVSGIQESSPPSHRSGQPAFPDSQSINVSDYGANKQSSQPEASESHFDPQELLNMCNSPHFNLYELLNTLTSPRQPAFSDFQPHHMAANVYFEDGASQVCRSPFHSESEPALMDFQPTNGINGEINNQLVQPGASESEIELTEYLNSVFENENNDEVTSRICIDKEEPSNRLLGFHHGTDNVSDSWGQTNGIPSSRSYRCVGSTTKTVKCFQSREEKEINLHEALQLLGSSSGSMASTRNGFSYIVTTKPIQHKSVHPLVFIAKACLGIILFVVFVLKLRLYGN